MFKSHGILLHYQDLTQNSILLCTHVHIIVKLLKKYTFHRSESYQILIGVIAAVAFIFYLMIWYGLAYYSTHTKVN